MPAPVVIVDYDPTWPDTFVALSRRVAEALGPLAPRIVHVGSTSVPGLPAKPVIDMIVVIPGADDLRAVIERLATIGYRHEGDQGVPDTGVLTLVWWTPRRLRPALPVGAPRASELGGNLVLLA